MGILGLLTEEQHLILHRNETGASFEQMEHFSGILAFFGALNSCQDI